MIAKLEPAYPFVTEFPPFYSACSRSTETREVVLSLSLVACTSNDNQKDE